MGVKTKTDPLKFDPSRTGGLRRRFVAEIRRRYHKLASRLAKIILSEGVLVFDNKEQIFPTNPLTTNSVWRFLTSAERITEFKRRLAQEIEWIVVQDGDDENQSDEDWSWLERYIQEGYQKGVQRSFDDARHGTMLGKKDMGWYQGTRSEFLNRAFGHPVAVERVKLLAGRAFTNLEAINEHMSNQIVRELVDGMIRGDSPRDVAQRIANDVEGISQQRALTLARTETIAAHAEGQLDSLEMLGITEIGVSVEWSTAGDSRVCELCAPMNKTVFKVSEARGLIPRHPNCRCAFIPANVGEGTEDQLRTKSRIQSAIQESIRRESPNKPLKKALKATAWAGVETDIDEERPEPLLTEEEILGNQGSNCGTGSGGFKPGNTCAKGGSSLSPTETQLQNTLKTLSELHTSAKRPGWKYASLEELTLAEGEWMTPAPLPEGIKRGKLKSRPARAAWIETAPRRSRLARHRIAARTGRVD